MKNLINLIIIGILLSCSAQEKTPEISFGDHDLIVTSLAKSWDEGIPLGNGIIGSLVWEKDDNLRLSLDRVDLWDLRPMENLNTPNYKFSWVYEQWKNNNYKEVQNTFDVPYDNLPAPSKIPGAGMEFNIKSFGKVVSNRLSVKDAVCEVKWENGTKFNSFVHASEQVGWFSFKGVAEDFKPMLIPPAYNSKGKNEVESPVTGQDLRRLNYPKGEVSEENNSITYRQKGWGGFTYEVNVSWIQNGNTLEGCWSISSDYPGWEKTASASEIVKEKLQQGYTKAFNSHKEWWFNYWAKSSISIPDSILEKQWYLEQYKFGSAARDGAPPISLQAVWTADNGKLPPWKGDFHHDLNTQLSYWPAYSGNHLDLEQGFLTWLTKYKPIFKKYTKEYYEADGLNVPGVTTLTGDPMGGWIQYSFGPTVSAWLGHHFYLHWRYSMDKDFLKEHAYPWLNDVAVYLNQITVKYDNGKRKLPISSSPEIHDNSKQAWFGETTNFDLSLIRWTYEKAAELALELGKKEDAEKWTKILSEWPELTVDSKTGLVFAPGTPYVESHRHFSHLIGYHPLGIIDRAKGEDHQKIINNTLENLLNVGSDYFTGYSFSWLGNLQARNFDGEGAAKSLHIFAENFCLPNSFHVNGEQHDKGYSKFKYRPFTLEGNFAFAAAIQEMLIQSHTGVIHIFPAIPESWDTLSFDQLRTEGAFLISAKKEKGLVKEVKVYAEKGGVLKLKNPFGDKSFKINTQYTMEKDILNIPMVAGQDILITS